MANPVCTVNGFITSAACFKNFSSEQRKSLLIYFSVLELAAIGGTNYSAQMGSGGTLFSSSVCYENLLIEKYVPPLPYLVIAFNNAVNAGAAPATTVTLLAEAIKCLSNHTPAQKDAMLLLLACQLGSHKVYPQ